MSDIKVIQPVPRNIVLGPGISIGIDPNESIEGVTTIVRDVVAKHPLMVPSPSIISFELEANTSGDVIAPLVQCFEQIIPTTSIARGVVRTVNFKDGSVIPTLNPDSPLFGVSVKAASEQYGVKYTLNNESGVYVLTAHSADVKSVMVDIIYQNLNAVPRA